MTALSVPVFVLKEKRDTYPEKVSAAGMLKEADMGRGPGWCFAIVGQQWGVSRNGSTLNWVVVENPLNMDDLEVPSFQETSN